MRTRQDKGARLLKRLEGIRHRVDDLTRHVAVLELKGDDLDALKKDMSQLKLELDTEEAEHRPLVTK
jgi:hypothetical protein